jgi:hypothetical protein
MPKVFSIEERAAVRRLAEEGHTHKVIADRMKESYPTNWGSPNAFRSVARILKEDAPSEDGGLKTLDEMTREERLQYIEERLRHTARFRMAFSKFSNEEKDVFAEEYLGIIRSTKSLTEPEEQMLFTSILELVLAFQALRRKEQEESWRDQSLDNKINRDDPRYRTVVDDKYQKEYDQHMKLYQKGIQQLKMSREQRLKELTSQKVNLVDLAQQLSSKNVQSEVAEEIERLSKERDEQLKKMLDEGHLHGVFEDV